MKSRKVGVQRAELDGFMAVLLKQTGDEGISVVIWMGLGCVVETCR